MTLNLQGVVFKIKTKVFFLGLRLFYQLFSAPFFHYFGAIFA